MTCHPPFRSERYPPCRGVANGAFGQLRRRDYLARGNTEAELPVDAGPDEKRE